MLMLIFYAGQDRFACPCDQIIEIIPPVPAKPMSHVPKYVSGSIIYGGKPIPVIDWSSLIHETPCHFAFHTRIILFEFKSHEKVIEFGLMAERVTKTMKAKKSAFIEGDIHIRETPFLRGVMTNESGPVQFVDIERLHDFIQPEIFEVV